MKLLPKTLLFIILILSLPAFAIEPIKIDLNHIGRQDTEVHEPGYTSWRIKGGSKTESITVNGVTFTLTSTGDSIGILASHWFAAGFPAAKLVSDGVRLEIKDGALDLSNNIRIQLKIEGLPNGIHSLQSYHNQADNPSTNTFSPMDIYFRGELMKTSFDHLFVHYKTLLLPAFFTNLKSQMAKLLYLNTNLQSNREQITER